MRRGRDYQRSKLYAAENEALLGHAHEERYLDNMAASQRFVTAVVRSAWMERTHPIFRQAVYVKRQHSGGALAYPERSLITITPHNNTNWLLMHELAHIISCVEARQDDVPIAWHGRDFARCYLGLVREWVSEQAYRDLRAAFTKHSVKARGTDAQHYARVERRKAAKVAKLRR